MLGLKDYGSLYQNEQEKWMFAGADCLQLAAEYGTPLYLMDEQKIRKNCRMYHDAIARHYDGRGMVLYASKAFSAKQIYRVVREEGLGIDVVSGGELYTALSAGFPADRIYFHGNNKSVQELSMALENGVARIVVDNAQELQVLNQLAGEKGIRQKILFRIKPGIDAHTHDFVQTGQNDSKFGVALDNGEAFAMIQQAQSLPFVEVVGVHCHIGSQIFEPAPFHLAAERMMFLLIQVRDTLGLTLQELNLGGGYGIRYTQADDPVPYDCYIEQISVTLKKIAQDHDFPLPFVLMEPGRSIVGEAGITLYTVGSVKRIPGVRTYVAVDGGMPDNPRFALYGAAYQAVVVSQQGEASEETVTIAGKCCESGDLLIRDISLPSMERGDTLAVLSTGAYNYSMSSNYNRLPRPAVVGVKDGKAEVWVRRETYEDLVRNDL